MEIIPLSSEDIPELQNLAQRIWNENYQTMISQAQITYMLSMMYSESQILKDLSKKDFWYWVEWGGSKLGYFHFYAKGEDLFISKIYLDSSIHGKGIAAKIIDFISEKANSLQKNRLQLTVNKRNFRAIAFYEKCGFRKLREEKFDIGNGFIMDDFIYELDV